ncbi:hypothetical protein DAPPUDRAFT_326826 [Daphnia pulex]|uniref:Uncharacterized protein n=1 Tax=Daphnia pulex TaxID=6669 RepID=E9H8W3_DAPPU|nr:hypothetical protein DAPPUDRAFT_326826 [Daphnia pulex]|eukprot:EFX71790.1 hypothetical protein DAPPUDRAFT_326826 [Daphnia pulex]
MEEKYNVSLLAAGIHCEAQQLIAEKVDELLAIEEQIDFNVLSLETCAYSANMFADILSKIQKMT